jgi:hypothetical protein
MNVRAHHSASNFHTFIDDYMYGFFYSNSCTLKVLDCLQGFPNLVKNQEEKSLKALQIYHYHFSYQIKSFVKINHYEVINDFLDFLHYLTL